MSCQLRRGGSRSIPSQCHRALGVRTAALEGVIMRRVITALAWVYVHLAPFWTDCSLLTRKAPLPYGVRGPQTVPLSVE